MQIMKNSFLLIITIIISIFPLWSSIKNYQSGVVQFTVLNEMRNNGLTLKGKELIETLDKTYPNISITTLPLYSIQALYDNAFKDYESALENTRRAEGINPYLMFNESIKLMTFKNLGIKDSAYFYAEKALVENPFNPRHYTQYASSLVQQDSIDRLVNEFFNFKFNFDKQIQMAFMSSVIGKEINDKRVDSLAKTLINKNKIELSLLGYYFLNGIENTKKSIETAKKAAVEFAQGQFSKASILYKNAVDLNPYDLMNIQNLGLSYFKDAKYELANECFQTIINSDYPEKMNAHYYLANSLNQLGETQRACENLSIATTLGHEESSLLMYKICNKLE